MLPLSIVEYFWALLSNYFVGAYRVMTKMYLIAARALPFRVGVNFNRDEATLAI